MKRCSVCGETKPLTEFYKNGQQRDGHMTLCKPCFLVRQAVYRKRPSHRETPPGTKYCSDCKSVRPNTEFSTNKNFHDGLDTMCKACRYARYRAWAEKNRDKLNEAQKRRYHSDPERFSDYQLKHDLGLRPGTYQRMLAEQDGRCAICGKGSPGNRRLRRFHVDHCHDTGAIRGLLCNNCNRGLGSFQHDVSILMAAMKYLSPRSAI